MNLPYTYSLLVAATAQRDGFIKLVGMHADREVRQMAEAGLIEATFNDGAAGSFTSINRVLEAGYSFLRSFNEPAVSKAIAADGRTPSQTATLAKWTRRLA
ncbi:MAG TPA: hypothetical protein VK474_06130 [Chthoniobacterales bacterium]|nr:hypothetical protein [Chthoniobacterales bacterium]